MTQEDKWIGSWYDQADRLQAIENSHGLDDNDLRFNMPTIICLGEESSGKSSTMERLASFKFFPTDRKLCTRLPVKLCALGIVQKNNWRRILEKEAKL